MRALARSAIALTACLGRPPAGAGRPIVVNGRAPLRPTWRGLRQRKTLVPER